MLRFLQPVSLEYDLTAFHAVLLDEVKSLYSLTPVVNSMMPHIAVAIATHGFLPIYHDKICSRIPCLTRGSHCDRRRKCWEEKTRLPQEMSFLSYTIASKSMVPNCTILKGQLNILSTSCTRSAVLQKPSQYSLKMKVQLFKLNQPPGLFLSFRWWLISKLLMKLNLFINNLMLWYFFFHFLINESHQKQIGRLQNCKKLTHFIDVCCSHVTWEISTILLHCKVSSLTSVDIKWPLISIRGKLHIAQEVP